LPADSLDLRLESLPFHAHAKSSSSSST
jgi:hypothetical protein